jgi:hypothetical protein
MRDAFAAVKRRERFGDAGDLPLVDVEIRGDCRGREERAGAAGRLGEFLQAGFRLLVQAD